MSAQSLDLGPVGDKNSRTLFRVVILGLIAGAAIASRLFSVIRKWIVLVLPLTDGRCTPGKNQSSLAVAIQCIHALQLKDSS